MRRIVAFVIGLCVVAAACGSQQEYGSDELRVDGEGGERLGAIEQQTPEPEQAATPVPDVTAAPQQRQPTPAPTPVLPTVTVKITSQGYQPFNFRVFQGTTVRVENHDGQPRTFTADEGAFDSGAIAPGASWTYEAETVGTFNFHDETRPFVVGQMEVVAQ